MTSERGSAALLLLAVAGLVLVLAIGVADIGIALRARLQAAAAADAAALESAHRLSADPGSPGDGLVDIYDVDRLGDRARLGVDFAAGDPADVVLINYRRYAPFAAMDVLVPRTGELIGGSQREYRYEVLKARMEEKGVDPEEYGWYLDLRRYGTVPHAGFGLGLERVVQFTTGMQNIRDVIPFPRTPGSAEF